MFKMKAKTVASIALVLLVIGVLAILLILSFSTLTTRETGLMSTILTFLSILATWIVSFLYSESIHKSSIQEAKEAHQENLRTYALKAAEKVTNLSDQLSQLSDFLEEELNSSDFETIQELVNSRDQRIVSAIQMLGMLKSVNDTTLSDWQGVIGEELEEKREEKEELQEYVLELTDRLERVLERENSTAILSHENNREEQLVLLREDLTKLISDITGRRPVPKIARKSIRRDVSLECLNCGEKIEYRQRGKLNTAKKVECKNCKSKFVSRYDDPTSNFYLQTSKDTQETMECEDCKETFSATLNSFPGSTVDASCSNCSAKYRLVRYHTGEVRLKRVGEGEYNTLKLTDDLVEKVKLRLPSQPWPKHIHKAVALQLGISNGMAQRAIRKLIENGTFKEQIKGQLFELKPVTNQIGEGKMAL